MQTVVETPTFYRRADKLLSEEEHAALINERADLTPDERRAVAAFAAGIKATRKRR